MIPGMNMGLPPKPKRLEEENEPEDQMHEQAESNGVTVAPDAVCYRDEQQVCANCSYMEEDGECAALKIQVEPGAGCNLFKERGL